MSVGLKVEYGFRRMVESDLDMIMRIEPTIYSHPWTRGNFIDSLQAGHKAWVMTNNEVIVGYAVIMIVLDESHLLNISIALPFQKQGLGHHLLNYIIKQAKLLKTINMFLEVRASNVSAISLYKKKGFVQSSLRRGYYPSESGREDAVLMGLAL